MICVSIGRGRHKQTIAEHKHLVEQGAELVELRLDYINRDVNLKRLLEDRPCPVVITCRRERDGGKWVRPEEERLMLLRTAIASGCEYIDLEEDIAASIPRFGKTKRIISLHNFRETPDNLDELHERLCSLNADIVKLATMAHNPHDNLRMLELIQRSSVPTIGICMGEIGASSRILAGKFGAPFSYATFHHERSLAPGQFSYRQMTDIFHYDRINAKTEVYGVIADPIGHSFSPIVHNAAFRHLNMNKVYVPFRVPLENLDQFLRDCREFDVKGLSVTIPHKESVISHITTASPSVQGIGAANTLVFNGGETLGYNTDFQAALDSLDMASGNPAQGKLSEFKIALVLGAGGVSKAVAYGLKKRGTDVVISSRTQARAEDLARRLECRVVEWGARHTIKADLVVNGTPVGMHPNVDETPYERRNLRPSTVVFDTVYNPEQTLLIKEAKQQGCTVVTGVDMFVRQAALQFKHFTGQEAPAAVMRDALKRATGPAKF